MATWSDLCRESLQAAGDCLRNECYRSSVSRAYYAAYAAATATLAAQGLAFAENRSGPPHHKVRTMIQENLRRLQRGQRRRLMAAINQLYESRLDADYRPPKMIGRDTARNSLTNATFVAGALGVIK